MLAVEIEVKENLLFSATLLQQCFDIVEVPFK